MTTLHPTMPVYRGYQIEMVKVADHWEVGIHPIRPELPILRQAFRPLSLPEEEALAWAKKRIDRVLSS